MNKENISLVGFYGENTKLLGELLADEMGMMFCDTNELIEYQFAPVKSVLRMFGIDGYNKYQRIIVKCTSSYANSVIALGSSSLEDEKSLKFVTDNSVLIYVKEDLKAQYLKSKGKYRKFFPKRSFKEFKERFGEMENVYKDNCDIEVTVDGKTNEEIITAIMNKLMEICN